MGRSAAATGRKDISRLAFCIYCFDNQIIVGVNAFTDGNEETEVNLLRISAEVEQRQLDRLAEVKETRDPEAVAAALAAVIEVAQDSDQNLMPVIIDAVKAYATLEEISAAMETVFGTYVERSIV